MRTIIYGVFNKETNKRVYTNINRYKCEEKVNELGANYEIRYKWFSI
jgi:hypothetical protein